MRTFVLTLLVVWGGVMCAQDVALAVHCPDVVKAKSFMSYDVYLKNEGSSRLKVPGYILGGTSCFFSHRLFDSTGKEIKILVVPEYGMSPNALADLWLDFIPGGVIGSSDKLKAEDLFPSPGRYRVQFTWEGFLQGQDGRKIEKKLHVYKWITVE